jgi:hypothetical protein
MFAPLMRQDRIKHLLPTLVPEVIRFVKNRQLPHRLSHPNLICVEAGLARKHKYHPIDQSLICQHWFVEKIRNIGDLNQLHFHHSGGYCPDLDK